jgi:hypothetical protein
MSLRCGLFSRDEFRNDFCRDAEGMAELVKTANLD